MIPSKNAAITALLILLVLTVITLVLPFYSHMWVLLLVPLTTFLLVIGYFFRLRVIYDPERYFYYKAMQFFLVVSPLVLAAAIYAILGGLISTSWVPIVYVIADIICLLVQGVGVRGIVNANDQDDIAKGLNILIVGMVLALLINLMFLFTIKSFSNELFAKFAPITVTLLVLATLFLLVRNVYRFQEFIYERMHVYDNPREATNNETIFYTLDFFPIVAIVVILSVYQLV